MGLVTTVEYCFMIAGHTKFSPDWCFGLFKRLFKRTRVSCMTDIADVVEASTNESGINKAHVVGSEGVSDVPMYDWVSYLNPFFKKVVGISKCHHFRLSSSEPGVLAMQEFSTCDSVKVNILKGEMPAIGTMPDEILPTGLSADRMSYLHKHIRQFCDPSKMDLVCPCTDMMEVDQ
jgi:hypothetical protein